jgi:tRNA nucleotidyltransferase (CCA-adding enzyme)
MAVELGERWGEVIDPHDGRSDLEAGCLRVLHDDSFRDDPTRVLRGIELAIRLDFKLERATAGAARDELASGILDHLSPARWRTAWRRAFGAMVGAGSACLRRSLELSRELGLLAALERKIVLDEGLLNRVDRLAVEPDSREPLDRARLLMRTLAGDSAAVARSLAKRWAPEGKEARTWESFPERRRRLVDRLGNSGPWIPSELGDALAGFDVEELALLELGASRGISRAVQVYRSKVRPARLGITGRDLLAAGYEPGPAIGSALDLTLRARIDGRISATDELKYACAALEEKSQ